MEGRINLSFVRCVQTRYTHLQPRGCSNKELRKKNPEKALARTLGISLASDQSYTGTNSGTTDTGVYKYHQPIQAREGGPSFEAMRITPCFNSVQTSLY